MRKIGNSSCPKNHTTVSSAVPAQLRVHRDAPLRTEKKDKNHADFSTTTLSRRRPSFFSSTSPNSVDFFLFIDFDEDLWELKFIDFKKISCVFSKYHLEALVKNSDTKSLSEGHNPLMKIDKAEIVRHRIVSFGQ